MLSFLEALRSPLVQLMIFVALWVLNFAFNRRNPAHIMLSGFYALLIWMIAGGIAGIPGDITRWDYPFLIMALISGYAIYLLSSWISDTWGTVAYNGEGAMILLAPFPLTIFILAPLMALKLILTLFFGGET